MNQTLHSVLRYEHTINDLSIALDMPSSNHITVWFLYYFLLYLLCDCMSISPIIESFIDSASLIRNDVAFVQWVMETLRRYGIRLSKTRITKTVSALLSLGDELSIIDKNRIDLSWSPSSRGGSFRRQRSLVFKSMFLEDFQSLLQLKDFSSGDAGIVDRALAEEICTLDYSIIKLIATCRKPYYFLRCTNYNLGRWFALMMKSLDLMIAGHDTEGYEVFCKGAHMIQQCEEKIKMYSVDLPLKTGQIRNSRIRQAILVEKGDAFYSVRDRIPVRKEFTDLMRHLLSEYLQIGKSDKSKKTRDRLFDFVVLCGSSQCTYLFENLLVQIVEAFQSENTTQTRKLKEKLGNMKGYQISDMQTILVKLCSLAMSRWKKRETSKNPSSFLTLDEWVGRKESS